MRGTRLPTLALIVALAALTVAALVIIDPVGPPSASGTPRAEGSGAPAVTAAPSTGLLAVEASGAGPSFSLETPPTRDVAQSKLWFHAGAWWGILLAEGSAEFRIHRFDWTGRRWLDTGTAVASRASVHPDVLSEGNQLWVATGGGQPTPRSTASLFRYTYDAESMRYTLDADFPVIIANERARSLTLARDDAGRLWAAWIGEDGLVGSHTEGNDWTWAEPQVVPGPGMDEAVDAVTMVNYGETVALVWSDQGMGSVSVAVPSVTDEGDWELSRVVVDGLQVSDDRLNASVLETDAGPRLFVVVETELDERTSGSREDPQVLLVVVDEDGSARQYLVGRLSDDHTRPIVLLDGENEVVYVVASSPSRDGMIQYKASGLDRISFVPGEGAVLVEMPSLAELTSVTSTKQTLGSSTGLLILASDAVAGTYAWGAAQLPGAGSPAPGSAPEPTPVDDPLLVATFDPCRPGDALDAMWVARSTGAATFSIADLPDGRRVAASAGASDGSSARICRELPPVADGSLRVEADVMVSRVGGSDVTVTSIRHDGAESAVVRLDDTGVFSYFDGAGQVRSAVPYATGAWYTSTVLVDLASGTYDWSVTRLSDGATVFAVEEAAWRTPATGPVTDVCFESSGASGPDSVFAIDRVRVER